MQKAYVASQQSKSFNFALSCNDNDYNNAWFCNAFFICRYWCTLQRLQNIIKPNGWWSQKNWKLAWKLLIAHTAMHGGHDVMLNQNKETNHVLINLDNVAVPSVGLRFLSAELCATLLVAQCVTHEDTNLLPKTMLEKSTMKSSGILKKKSNTK